MLRGDSIISLHNECIWPRDTTEWLSRGWQHKTRDEYEEAKTSHISCSYFFVSCIWLVHYYIDVRRVSFVYMSLLGSKDNLDLTPNK